MATDGARYPHASAIRPISASNAACTDDGSGGGFLYGSEILRIATSGVAPFRISVAPFLELKGATVASF